MEWGESLKRPSSRLLLILFRCLCIIFIAWLAFLSLHAVWTGSSFQRGHSQSLQTSRGTEKWGLKMWPYFIPNPMDLTFHSTSLFIRVNIIFPEWIKVTWPEPKCGNRTVSLSVGFREGPNKTARREKCFKPLSRDRVFSFTDNKLPWSFYHLS